MITNKAHDFGAMVLAEGIERREEFHFAEISGSSSRRGICLGSQPNALRVILILN